ncbi:hypothetical protein GQX74_008028 [Glossina fuscipes]|nr:hypothetical protein GQX74_008028 [Glossina fuscipes]
MLKCRNFSARLEYSTIINILLLLKLYCLLLSSQRRKCEAATKTLLCLMEYTRSVPLPTLTATTKLELRIILLCLQHWGNVKAFDSLFRYIDQHIPLKDYPLEYSERKLVLLVLYNLLCDIIHNT